jgi:UDP-N-acetylmuramate dehydrogenase
MKSFENILEKKFGVDFKKEEKLSRYTTLKIGGKARFFIIVKNIEDLAWAVKKAQEMNVPYFVLGGGSNVLIADTGFDGLVIKNEASNLIHQSNIVICDSGLMIPIMLKKLAETNMGGLEFLAGIPGTIGGAVCGNVGAWGKTMVDIVLNITVLGSNGVIKKFSKKEIGFYYRGSLIKKAVISEKKFPPVILNIQMKTTQNTKEGILRIISNYIKMRQQKQPVGYSAGSTFKNIYDISKISDEAKIYVMEGIIPAGLVMDKLGFMGKTKGKITVSDKHANFILNSGKGSSSDYAILVDEMHSAAKKILGLDFEKEIVYVGNPYEKVKRFLGIFEKND